MTPGLSSLEGRELHPQAKLAMQLGLVSALCCLFVAPVALVVGLLAQRDLARHPGRYGNASHATIGVVLGGTMCALIVLAAVAAALSTSGSRGPAGISPSTSVR
jgi:Na+/proline symporter